MHHDGQISRECPGRGGPDRHRHRAAGQRRIQPGRVRGQRKRHVDRGRAVVLVLHLGLGQRREARRAPVDRLQSAVHPTRADELPQLAQDVRLVPELHRPIRVAPVPQAAQPLELLPLDVDELLGVGAAQLPLLGDGHLARLGPKLPVHLVLDGQPVAVPARHVGRVVAEHGSGLDDHVLQDLVQRVPHVDVAVGIRGSVVQDPARPPLPDLPQRLVQRHLLPLAQELRLPLGEVGLHGKLGLGQVQGGLVVHGAFRLRRGTWPHTTRPLRAGHHQKTPRSGRRQTHLGCRKSVGKLPGNAPPVNTRPFRACATAPGGVCPPCDSDECRK